MAAENAAIEAVEGRPIPDVLEDRQWEMDSTGTE
jgi:hypothetical protein